MHAGQEAAVFDARSGSDASSYISSKIHEVDVMLRVADQNEDEQQANHDVRHRDKERLFFVRLSWKIGRHNLTIGFLVIADSKCRQLAQNH